MATVAFRKRIIVHKARYRLPRKRLFKVKSLYPRRTIYIHKGRFSLFKHRDQRKRFLTRFNTIVGPRTSFKQKYTPKKTSSWEISDSDLAKVKDRWTKNWNEKKRTWANQAKGYTGPYGPGYAPTTDPKFKDGFDREREKAFGKKGFKVKKKKDKVFKPELKKVINRTSWDTSKFRTYTYYGKMGEKDPKLIVKIAPTAELSRLYLARKSSSIEGIATVIRWTKQAMETMLTGLKIYAAYIIDKYVPKDTGKLRKAMRDSIEQTKINGFHMKVVLDTKGVDYANPVDNMPESMIRHDMAVRRVSGGRYKILHDPKAVEHWHRYIKMNLQKRAKQLIATMISEVMMAWSFSMPVSSGFAHPPTGTKTIAVESERRRRIREEAYESWRKLNKRRYPTIAERDDLKSEWIKKVQIILDKEIEVPARSDDATVRTAEMRYRKWNRSTKLVHKSGTLYGTKRVKIEPLVINYTRKDILGMFKITGIPRGM